MSWDDFEKKLFSTIAVLPARVTRFLRDVSCRDRRIRAPSPWLLTTTHVSPEIGSRSRPETVFHAANPSTLPRLSTM